MRARLHWNSPWITAEAFDDEVVIVNFESGNYHSLQGTGREIWAWLQHPHTVEEITARATRAFVGDPEEIAREVGAFVARLTADRLVTEAPADAPSASTVQDGPVAAFAPPTLNTFSDMEDLLLLDPIHEVDAAGWPVARTERDD